ncbi:FHA domain-containing protein, partial [Kitasatospora sp. NPDC001574]
MRYEIVDLGSHNGIFLNGQRVERQLIGPQDRLT